MQEQFSRPRESDGLRAALWRLETLTLAEQLTVHALLGSWIVAAGEPEPPVTRELRELRTAYADLETAAALIGVAVPTQRAYQALLETHPELTSVSVITSSFGTWRRAQDCLRGAHLPMTRAQRRLRRRMSGRRRTHEDYVHGIRLSLASDPESTNEDDYNAFVDLYNTRLGENDLPLVRAATVRAYLGVSWPDALRLARGELTLEEAVARAPLQGAADDGRLTGVAGVARVLAIGHPQATSASHTRGFPAPVALSGRRRVWLVAEVEQFGMGVRFPSGERYRLQQKLVFGPELAQLLGITHSSLQAYLCQGRWHLVPEPAGRAAGAFYWWRSQITRWIDDRGRNARATGRTPRR